MLQRPIQEPTGEGLEVWRCGPLLAHMGLDGVQMVLTALGARAIVRSHLGLATELLGHKRYGFGWGTAEVIGEKPMKRNAQSCRA